MIFCNASKFSAAIYRVDLLPAHDGGEGTSGGDAKPRQNRETAIEPIEYASKYSRAIERQKKSILLLEIFHDERIFRIPIPLH